MLIENYIYQEVISLQMMFMVNVQNVELVVLTQMLLNYNPNAVHDNGSCEYRLYSTPA